MTDQPTRKEITHDRIVRTAARAIRRSGYDGTGVADIMKEAGLTHGGFYAHFPSRTALLAEAADSAGAESVARLRKAAEGLAPAQAIDAMLDNYLSDRHVNAPESGCPVAALVSEMPRQEPEVRAAATHRIVEMIDFVAGLMPADGALERREAAMAAISAMLGALVLARAVDDPALSAQLRAAARRFIDAGLD